MTKFSLLWVDEDPDMRACLLDFNIIGLQNPGLLESKNFILIQNKLLVSLGLFP